MLGVRIQFTSPLTHMLLDKIEIISYQGLLSAIAAENGSYLCLLVKAIGQLQIFFVKSFQAVSASIFM